MTYDCWQKVLFVTFLQCFTKSGYFEVRLYFVDILLKQANAVDSLLVYLFSHFRLMRFLINKYANFKGLGGEKEESD